MPSRTAAPSESSNYGLTVSTKTCRFIAFPFLRFLRADAQGARPPLPPKGEGGGGLHRPPARPPVPWDTRPPACPDKHHTVMRPHLRDGREAVPRRDTQLLEKSGICERRDRGVPEAGHAVAGKWGIRERRGRGDPEAGHDVAGKNGGFCERRDRGDPGPEAGRDVAGKNGAFAKGGTEAVPRRDAMLLEKMGRFRKAGPRRSQGGTQSCWKKWGVCEGGTEAVPRRDTKLLEKMGRLRKAGPRRSRGGTTVYCKKWGGPASPRLAFIIIKGFGVGRGRCTPPWGLAVTTHLTL